MFKSTILIIFPIVATSLFTGCTGVKKPNDVAAAGAAPATSKLSAAVTPGALQGCTIPSSLTSTGQSIPLSQLSKMSGTFALTSLTLFSQTQDAKNAVLNAFAVGATIKTGANGIRDTKLQNICEQSSAAAYTETLPLVMTFHLPTLRVTEFDLSDPQDLPATNHPSYADFVVDSQGKMSLKNAFSDKGPPYTAALTLTDWLKTLPAQPALSTLSDGSIEMRIHWAQKGTTTDALLHFQQQ